MVYKKHATWQTGLQAIKVQVPGFLLNKQINNHVHGRGNLINNGCETVRKLINEL